MPGFRETVASFIAPPEVETDRKVKLNKEVAFSESMFTTGTFAYKYDPDLLKSRKGADIYKRMMIDEQVKAIVRFRRDAITGRDFFFQFDQNSKLPEEEQEARRGLFNSITDQMTGSFNDSLNAIMCGVWQGFSITEKIHTIIEFEEKPYVGLKALKKKPHETFRFHVDQYGNILRLEQELDGNIRKIPIDKMVHYVQNPEEDEQYGGSELREAYRSWLSKDIAIKFWNIHLERTAGGVWVAKAKEGKTIAVGSAEHTAIINVISNLSSASSVLLPNSIELENIMPTNTQAFKEAVEFHDLAIAKSMLVPNLLGISHTGQTGAFSQSQTQFKAFMLVLNADTTRLESVMDEQVFKELGELNFADKQYPKFKFKPLSIDQIIEMLGLWNELVGKDTVEPSDTDEAHIRNLLEMPEKGEPLPRRQQAIPSAQPTNPDESTPPNPSNANDPDEVDAIRDAVAWKASFTKAQKRVRFTVIDRKSTDEILVAMEKLNDAVVRIVTPMIQKIMEERLGTATGNNDLIAKLGFNANQKNRVRQASRKTLERGWKLGTKHAQDEISSSRGSEFTATFSRLDEEAAAYFNAQAFHMSGNLTGEIESIIKNTLTNGLKFNWTTTEVVDNIYKTLVRKGIMMSASAANGMSLTEAELLEALEGAGITAGRLQTIIRTSYFDALNEARYNFFTDPALGDFVEAMEYSAILDSRTTAICSHLDGKVFSRDSNNWDMYRPPNHFNCRSLLIAVTQNDTWKEARDPTLDPQEGFGGK